MGKLIVMRHGETHFNQEGRYTGSKDIDLNDKGVKQAKDMSQKLKGYSIDRVIASPMKRAQQTAHIIAKELGVSVDTIEGLQERHVGVYEGLTRAEIKVKYPHLWERGITRIYNEAPDGGETLQEVEKRVFNALDKIYNIYGKEHNLLVVTHSVVAKMIFKYHHNPTDEEYYGHRLNNCDIFEYHLG